MTASDAEAPKGEGPPSDDGTAGCALRGRRGVALTELFMAHGTQLAVADRRLLDGSQPQDVCFHIVLSGLLLGTIDLPDGRRQVLCMYGPGDVVFGGGAFNGKSIRLRAAGDVVLQTLDGAALHAALAGGAATAMDLLLAEAARQIDAVLLHSAAIGRLSSDERLATFFLEMALRQGRPWSGRPWPRAMPFDFRMRREDIADYLGLNPDTLSRGMSRLRQQGVVVVLQGGRVLLQIEALCERTPLAGTLLSRFGLAFRT